jgi:sarcosine oxidase subunit beta
MLATADVAIIGGGIVGSSIAYHLAEAGCSRVVVLESESEQGLGSTGKATGGVRAQFSTAINIRLSLYSIEFFSRFEEATGFPSGYQPYGYLFLATTQHQLDQLKQNRERQAAVGLNNVEILTPKEISGIVPQLRLDDLLGGSFCPTDGLIDPLALMRGFTGRARVSGGVEISLDTKVIAIELDGDGVSGVVTNRGHVATRTVVNAAGPWAASVAGLAGVDLPVTPLRRQLVATKPFGLLPDRLPMVIDMSNGFHFRQDEKAGSPPGVLMAWPDPDQAPGFETDFDTGFVDKIMECAVRRAPCLSQTVLDPGRFRAGLYEMTPDHHAIIGEAPGVKGLFLANGFSGHGVMHSPATGRIVSDLIMNGRCEILDASELGLERFAENRLIVETAVL